MKIQISDENIYKSNSCRKKYEDTWVGNYRGTYFATEESKFSEIFGNFAIAKDQKNLMRGRQLYQKQDENGIATGHYIQFIQLDSKTIFNQGMFGFLFLTINF